MPDLRTPSAALLLLASVCALWITSATPAIAGDVGPPDSLTPEDFFLQRVRPVLEERCWRCHGPLKERSNLRLDSRAAVLRGGHVKDVEAGHPETSRLIDAVRYDDADLQMPPDGKLDDDQIADLVTWVRLGVPWAETRAKAPAARSGTSGRDSKEVAHADGRSAEAITPPSSWIAFAGRLHPLVVHFPIALILAAALGEGAAVVAVRRGRHRLAAELTVAARYALFLGGLGAVAATSLGWAAAAQSRFAGEPAIYLEIHRWLGTALAGSVVVTSLLAWKSPGRPWARAADRIALVASAVLVAIVGHLGGSLTHGIGWLGLP